MEEAKSYVMKPLEEMNVIDDFLFTEIMSDEKNGLEVCRMILSCVLKREVGNISFTAQKNVPGVSEKSHGIRLDAYVTEDMGNDISVYDVEPDKRSSKRSGLPKRSRYYGDLIDIQLLNMGADYDKLPELVTIFILSYDPFDRNSMYYEAGTVIRTHPDVPYNDGIRRIYLFADGELSEDADEDELKLKILLRYINESTEANVVDDNTRKLDDIVRKTKTKKDIGIKYMKSWERERELKEEGAAEERERREAAEKQRDAAEKRAEIAEKRVNELEALLSEKKSQ